MSTLVSATKSTDTVAPTATISSPPSSVTDGASVTVTGTATDTGGGVVAGVEVSTDGGATWHPGDRRARRAGPTRGSRTARPRPSSRSARPTTAATSDAATAGTTVNVNCPCSICGNASRPPADGRRRHRARRGRRQVHVRRARHGHRRPLLQGDAPTPARTSATSGRASGERLAQATFTGETRLRLADRDVLRRRSTIQPNTTYVASYFAPDGHYSATNDYFWRTPRPGPTAARSTDAAPLHARQATRRHAPRSTASSPTAPAAVPAAASSAPTTGSTSTSRRRRRPARSPDVIAAAGGLTSANLSWTAPADRRHAVVLPDHAVHRRDRADRDQIVAGRR